MKKARQPQRTPRGEEKASRAAARVSTVTLQLETSHGPARSPFVTLRPRNGTMTQDPSSAERILETDPREIDSLADSLLERFAGPGGGDEGALGRLRVAEEVYRVRLRQRVMPEVSDRRYWWFQHEITVFCFGRRKSDCCGLSTT